MPHLVLSVSGQLAQHKTNLLKVAHEAMLSSGIAPALDVKSRAIVCDDFLVGDGSLDAFAHVEIRILQKAERTNEVQKALSDTIMQALKQAISDLNVDVQVSCDIVLMNSLAYGKDKVVASPIN